MDVHPHDLVLRTSPVPPERSKRERHGMIQFSTYTVADVGRGGVVKLVGVAGWHAAKSFDVVLGEPCA